MDTTKQPTDMGRMIFFISIAVLASTIISSATIQYGELTGNTLSQVNKSDKMTYVVQYKANDAMQHVPYNKFKRWYSVPNTDVTTDPYHDYRWPPVCQGGEHWLRFCFADQRSMSMLLPIVKQTIVLWTPAMEASHFKIWPDPACHDQIACLCNHVDHNGLAVSDDTLTIWVRFP